MTSGHGMVYWIMYSSVTRFNVFCERTTKKS